MFKLGSSRAEAVKMAERYPGDYQVGSGVWVTVRFSADWPVPLKRWKKWLDESYELSRTTGKA